MGNVLERDLTKTNGVIANNLASGFVWLRMPDTGLTKRNPCGFDGLLLFGRDRCWFVEVKVDNTKFTESEKKFFAWCKENKKPYLLLKYYTKLNVWYMEDLTCNGICSGTLKEICEFLIDY